MTWAAANLSGVTSFDRAVSGRADYGRTMRRTVSISLGTMTTTGLTAGAATLTAAWIIANALGGAGHTAVPDAPDAFARTAPGNGLAGMMIADASPQIFTGSTEPQAMAPPQVVESGKGPRLRAPFPRARAEQNEIAGAVASILPQAAPPAGFVMASLDLFDPAPMSVSESAPVAIDATQPPPSRSAARSDLAPTSTQRALDAARSQVKRVIADVEAKPAAPQLAAVTPGTPDAPASGLTGFLKKLFAPRPARDVSIAAAVPDADAHTAIYDIEAHTVYLPNGQKLEAHSGLGGMLDDPQYIDKKARGPTPPNVYDLALRDGLFHGVQAIRLTPVSDDKMHGRDGILAHPYMLGPSGQSFGCVSFKDYSEFLQAFERGEVDRLVVVPHLEPRVSDNGRLRGDYQRYAVND
jgi:Protein of unknown function (DUF2778)